MPAYECFIGLSLIYESRGDSMCHSSDHCDGVHFELQGLQSEGGHGDQRAGGWVVAEHFSAFADEVL